jgi:hypothetical protein
MSIFKRHKTIEDLLPMFLLDREAKCKIKNSQSYRAHMDVFVSCGIPNLRQHSITLKFVRVLSIPEYVIISQAPCNGRKGQHIQLYKKCQGTFLAGHHRWYDCHVYCYHCERMCFCNYNIRYDRCRCTQS